MKPSAITAGIFLAVSAQTSIAFDLKSADLKRGATLSEQQVANGFGCTGGNLSPQLSWNSPPKGTRSFAVTVFDPDAPTGSGWWHWVVWNIPASISELPAGIGQSASLPEGSMSGRTDVGTPGYFGACPPKGDKPHRYIFKVHALKVEKLELPEDPMPALVGFMLNANSLGTASLTVKYRR
jgi:hypothetical protein